jgi:hypothetical protein
MTDCCVEVLLQMQDVAALSKWLKLFLVASPFATLLENADSPAEGAATELGKMAVTTAIEKLNNKAKLPDVGDAIKAADTITKIKMKDLAFMHYLKHQGDPEAPFWNKMATLYGS